MMGDRLFCQHTKKALLSISDGRASSFFNTFIKIITPQPFFRAADFRVQRYEEKTGKSEKFGEIRGNSEKNQRNSEKNKRKSEKIGEKRKKTEKFGENQRKSEKIEEKRKKSEKIREIQRKS